MAKRRLKHTRRSWSNAFESTMSVKLRDCNLTKMPHKYIVSWNTMLSLYAKSGSVENLRALFDQMPSRDSVSYNTVIAAYSGNGQVVHGKAVLSGVDSDFLVSSALVDMGYAQNGQDLEALSLYENLLQKKLKPDDVTFVAVLSACSHAGLVQEGR
ncbi:putative pentatricopeptide repeat-containing protein At5g37570 [Hibiscus syriacus]|uniref:putative pentatricopeptide repeat-containing protein At5g37570 n=1 Tax=Hibiscus syriacus TaxID=106335 RepID=UPI001924ED4B|nr:putative pentatricopeptide repeat-containing protein At5g37570 [Hibiscus syriacus]